MNVMERLSRLAASGATLTIDGETDEGPAVVTIKDSLYDRPMIACTIAELPAVLEKSFALWEEYRSEMGRAS